MITIFRIQDKDGRGPFKPGFSHKWCIDRMDHENLPPWSVELGRVDKKLITVEHGGAACRTLEQLRRWFIKQEYETLLEHGYNAVEMEVNRIIAESNIQLFFGRSKPLKEDIKEFKLY